MIRTRLLCEFFFCGSATRHRLRSLTSFTPHSWGHSAGSLSIAAHVTTAPVNPPFKAAIFVRIRDLKHVLKLLSTLFTVTAIELHVYSRQDRQPETPGHLRPLGPVYRMCYGSGHFGMSPCCSICYPHGRYQHRPCSCLSRRSGHNLEY